MSLEKLVINERYRPKTLEDIILPDRIKSPFKNGLNENYIFHGHFGTGKTSLARILIGTYSKDKAFLELNSSYFTSIEVLRNEVDKFCKTIPMFETNDDIKYVFLDEFERVSPQFQDAFKAFVEKYNKNVRFILNTNHYDKISKGIKSRFISINFDSLNKEEEKSLKINIFKSITNNILPKENTTIEKNDLIHLINKNFPDVRSIIKSLGNFIKTGEINSTPTVDTKTKLELYNLLYKQNLNYLDAYNFVLDNFGSDNIDIMFKMLGLDFTDWVIENKPEDVEKLFECNYVIANYITQLGTESDPFILGMTLFGKFNDILRK